MTIQWTDFVQQVEDELSTGNRGHLILDEFFAKERDLTKAIVHGLRRLFKEAYPDSHSLKTSIYHHVVARQGDDPEDRRAWTDALPDKWIRVYGVTFVPDILIRPTLNPVTEVLPIEIKFVRKPAASQAVATAIGQAFAYRTRYPRSIVFVGVQRGLMKGTSGITNLSAQSGDEATLRRTLEENGIRLIFREVGIESRSGS